MTKDKILLVTSLKNSIEKEYGIKTKPFFPGNPHANTKIDRIYQVLENLVQTFNIHETYVDDADP